MRESIRSFQLVRKDILPAFAPICSRFQRSSAGRKESMAKRTTITLETDSLLILRGRSSTRAWCPRCAADVEMIAMKDAGVISNLDQAALEEWLRSEELHRSQAEDGSVLTCLSSLLARVQNTTTS